MKMRETDRLIHNLAICVQKPKEPLKEAEKDVRSILEASARKHNMTLLEVARGMWQLFKEAKPRKTVNKWCKERLGKLSIAEFDYHVDILKRYQKNARNFQKVKEEKGLL